MHQAILFLSLCFLAFFCNFGFSVLSNNQKNLQSSFDPYEVYSQLKLPSGGQETRKSSARFLDLDREPIQFSSSEPVTKFNSRVAPSVVESVHEKIVDLGNDNSESSTNSESESESSSTAIANVTSYNVFTNVDVDNSDHSKLIIKDIFEARREINDFIVDQADSIAQKIMDGLEDSIPLFSDAAEALEEAVAEISQKLAEITDTVDESFSEIIEIIDSGSIDEINFEIDYLEKELDEIVEEYLNNKLLIEEINEVLASEDGDQCGVLRDCESCSLNGECGWCESSGKCIEGDEYGPMSGTCSFWRGTECPSKGCPANKDCSVFLKYLWSLKGREKGDWGK